MSAPDPEREDAELDAYLAQHFGIEPTRPVPTLSLRIPVTPPTNARPARTSLGVPIDGPTEDDGEREPEASAPLASPLNVAADDEDAAVDAYIAQHGLAGGRPVNRSPHRPAPGASPGLTPAPSQAPGAI